MYQLQMRLTDILNYPLSERLHQLRMIENVATTKDLQAFFPILVQSIFGNMSNNPTGWNLRTTSTNSSEYYLLYNYFNPHESFFRLIYRLQSSFVKFELPFPELPRGFRTMLENGRIDSFYSKLISIDHFMPKMLSLSKFFIHYFCIIMIISSSCLFQMHLITLFCILQSTERRTFIKYHRVR